MLHSALKHGKSAIFELMVMSEEFLKKVDFSMTCICIALWAGSCASVLEA